MVQSAPAQTPKRQRDAERTRADILTIATREFAAHGYTGARVDDIAEATNTTKRMLYYYFGSKEGLYLAALEDAYQVIRELEQSLDVEGLPPTAALRQLAEATFDHHTSHEDFVRLVSIENTHHAEHLRKSATIGQANTSAVGTLTRVLERGIAAGEFRDDLDALDVHAAISAYAFFHVANRHTFAALFSRDLLDPARHDHNRRIAGDIVIGLVSRAKAGA